ncbi:hypothetical protein MTR67_035258 [Solanum verrucosum]|uniref:Tf2-1-like SH3-like domain-containing protein n=1 Tax=Solanum verrucosum TaxID=315347 RepID=A0AAF0U981_SOLVR|nr:hypothetical protein MTR67_035258 [Solanum verrucosum]
MECPCQLSLIEIVGQAEGTIRTLEDMLRVCVIDFKGNWDDHLPLIEIAYNNSYHSSIGMDPFEVLYGRRCRFTIGWFEVGEVTLIGPELVHEAMEKVRLIRERLRTAQSKKKSYADVRRRDLEFDVHDWVYLKISPMKGVMRFGKKGKLSPHYIGPYKILRHVGKVAYELSLPNDLAFMHPIFHIYVLKKGCCRSDIYSSLEGLGVDENLSYEEVPVEILDRQVNKLRNKEVSSVKVLWRNHLVEGATWEAEADMMSQYPYLFPSTPTLASGNEFLMVYSLFGGMLVVGTAAHGGAHEGEAVSSQEAAKKLDRPTSHFTAREDLDGSWRCACGVKGFRVVCKAIGLGPHMAPRLVDPGVKVVQSTEC